MTAAKAATLRYVLSAGRTGTVFLERLVNGQMSGVFAAHEPAATRFQMVLANLRNDTGIGAGLLQRLFERSREKRVSAAPDFYVEINPFLCAMTDLLPKAGHRLRIVHMVRDPATWAVSITSFKASTRFRGIIDHIPFAKPYPAPRPAGWRGLGEFERALWRWRWCNERIGALRKRAAAFAIVRYEDLFSEDSDLQAATLDTIVQCLGLPEKLNATDEAMSVRANPSEGSGPEIDCDAVRRICGGLARTYGYEY